MWCSIAHPEKISGYLKKEKAILAAVAVSGTIYNIGMAAGPYMEGRLAQCLYDIFKGRAELRNMIALACAYVVIILIVQGMRALKRYTVRVFANDVSRDMRMIIYRVMLRMPRSELSAGQTGSLMTKTIADVDACSEGMRKFTTEIFDTGVVMVVYMVMLLHYDWKLTLMSVAFMPFAYVMAGLLKKKVADASRAYRESESRLNTHILDRIGNAMTYRIYGEERNRNLACEDALLDYERKSVKTGLLEGSLAPVYDSIAMCGTAVIIYFGSKNVIGTGWTAWNIAAFTTFLSCFTKLAVKVSHAAKLFNAVQKAQVSWQRIRPIMERAADMQGGNGDGEDRPDASGPDGVLRVNDRAAAHAEGPGADRSSEYAGGPLVSFTDVSAGYDDFVLRDISFTARAGEIIGVTGQVASGKSLFGKIFIRETPIISGSAMICGIDAAGCPDPLPVAYMGHEPELMTGTIAENTALDDDVDVWKFLGLSCLDREVAAMPDRENTVIGEDGAQLSGGQKDRLALARTLAHRKPVIVLDDPFSAVDMPAETELLENIRNVSSESVIFLISHRLTHFPELSRILFIDRGTVTCGTHGELMKIAAYRDLYEKQAGGTDEDEK